MTIKAIKEEYKRYGCSGSERNGFTVYDYGDGNGKVVIVVTYSRIGKDVVQAVRVMDGKKLIEEGRCRPCDNMDDAIDVAGEMMVQEHTAYDWELEEARKKSTDWLKNWIWLASTGQPIPGCLSAESLREVLIERGEDGRGYHNT